MPQIPSTGTLADRVCEFFRANRDEELSTRDIADKFNVASSSVTPCLVSAVANRSLVRTKDSLGGIIYIAGPALEASTTEAGSMPVPVFLNAGSAPVAKKPVTRKTATRLPLLDVNAVPISDGNPNDAPPSTQLGRCIELIRRIQPNQFAELDDGYEASLRKATTQFKATVNKQAAFTIRRMDTGKCRIWRTA